MRALPRFPSAILTVFAALLFSSAGCGSGAFSHDLNDGGASDAGSGADAGPGGDGGTGRWMLVDSSDQLPDIVRSTTDITMTDLDGDGDLDAVLMSQKGPGTDPIPGGVDILFDEGATLVASADTGHQDIGNWTFGHAARGRKNKSPFWGGR